MKLIKFLNSPYPFYDNTKQSFGICLSIGIFIAAFCYFFKPFGIDEVPVNGQLGYGLISFLVCSFYIWFLPIVFGSFLNSERWKVYKEILWILLIVVSLAAANYYYSGIFFPKEEGSIKIFLFVLISTATVALIPAIAIILYKQLFEYKRILEEIKKIDSKLVSRNNSFAHSLSPKTLRIQASNKKDKLEIEESDLLYISSSGNYVEVYYTEDQTVVKKLLRNNISKVEKQLKKFKHVIRCHRSYLVNLNAISSITGNLQGYMLSFERHPIQVPVSRSYTKRLKQVILSN